MIFSLFSFLLFERVIWFGYLSHLAICVSYESYNLNLAKKVGLVMIHFRDSLYH